jgi:hypothetical protein
MTFQRGGVFIAVMVAAAAAGTALAQAPARAVPDFGGVWTHPATGFGPALKEPGPIRNLTRTAKGTSDNTKLVGDYKNPILRPEAAEIVRRRGEISKSGKIFPDPDVMCLQQPVPYILWNFDVVFIQQKDKVTLVYQHDNDYRQVWLNQGHPADLKPSAHGHSVGHYEGDTLVIDTVGIAVGPYTTIDRLGTPYSDSLHVVERYRMLPYEQAKAAMDLAEKEHNRAGPTVDPNYRGHGVQLEFVVEDHKMFTVPWSATITYLKRENTGWEERICAENVEHDYNFKYFVPDNVKLPQQDRSAF